MNDLQLVSKQDYLDAIEKYGSNFTESEFQVREGTSMTDLDYEFFVDFLRFRQWANFPFLITSAYRPGDPRAHGKGLALDIIMFDSWLNKPVSPKKQWLLGTTWPWFGVGIYFDWHFRDKNENKRPAVGLHIDRHVENRPVRWLRFEETVNHKTESLYFYQSTNHGRFYNKKTQRHVDLANVIEQFRKP